jgi:phosphopantothenoylcysteine decarboxylase/phosphopantothenate--cysteine ligase
MTLDNKRILITCGPTWVPVDIMRVISNRSTGALGQMIARDFADAGASVTLLEGPTIQKVSSGFIKVLPFIFFDELAALLKKELKKNYDVCIHAAAVSDYQLKDPGQTKISSRLKQLNLVLVPTPKIIDTIKHLNPDVFLVGFKLEADLTAKDALDKTRGLFEDSRCDLVVANSLQGEKYSGYIVDKNKNISARQLSRQRLSKTLVKRVKENL